MGKYRSKWASICTLYHSGSPILLAKPLSPLLQLQMSISNIIHSFTYLFLLVWTVRGVWYTLVLLRAIVGSTEALAFVLVLRALPRDAVSFFFTRLVVLPPRLVSLHA